MKRKSLKQKKISKILPGISSVLFILFLITSLIVNYKYVSFSVSQDFSDKLKPFAIIAAVLLTIMFAWGFVPMTKQLIKSKKRNSFRKMFYSLYLYLLFFLVVGLVSYLFYSFFLYTPAKILHNNAKKEYFSMDVTIESVSSNTSRRKLHPEYKYSAFFTAPDYFDSQQLIKMTTEQRDNFFLNKEFPNTVTLYGYMSDYGFDFHCCIDTNGQ
jgi:cytoskeletal protein RodZ